MLSHNRKITAICPAFPLKAFRRFTKKSLIGGSGISTLITTSSNRQSCFRRQQNQRPQSLLETSLGSIGVINARVAGARKL